MYQSEAVGQNDPVSSTIFLVATGSAEGKLVKEGFAELFAGEAAAGDDLAFGLRSNLDEFSQATGYKNYRQFTSGGFQPNEIEAAIKNPANRLHFNLTDFYKRTYLKFDPLGRISHGNITNWELHTIYNTQGALGRTTFYRFMDGAFQVVPKPF